MKVKFKGCSNTQANWGQGEDPQEYLEVGKEYNVVKTENHTQHTLWWVEGCDVPFNSACFELLEAK